MFRYTPKRYTQQKQTKKYSTNSKTNTNLIKNEHLNRTDPFFRVGISAKDKDYIYFNMRHINYIKVFEKTNKANIYYNDYYRSPQEFGVQFSPESFLKFKNKLDWITLNNDENE